jgi:hypothetical protein
VVDGTQTVIVTASAAGYDDGSSTLDVTDFESWLSPTHPCDVNVDGEVTPLDVLLLINDINANGSRPLPIPYVAPDYPPPFLDPSGDGELSPLDVLTVINYINDFGSGTVQGASGEGKGETRDGSSLGGAGEGEASIIQRALPPAPVRIHVLPGHPASILPSHKEESRLVLSRADCPDELLAGRSGLDTSDLEERDDLEALRSSYPGDEWMDLEDILSEIAPDIAEAWSIGD